MNSAPNNGFGYNEMNQPHVDHYQYYDGSQTNQNSNMGNVIVQPMDQQTQMYDPSIPCNPPKMGYKQQQYDERFGNQIHHENMQTQAFYGHHQTFSPSPSFHPCSGNVYPQQQFYCEPQQYQQASDQNMGNHGHPEMPSYPSSVNSMLNEAWHSSNPPSVYNDFQHRQWQQNAPMNTSAMHFQSTGFPNSAFHAVENVQQQPQMSYHQPPNYGPVYNNVAAQMPTFSGKMMNMDFRNATAGEKHKIGAPIKVACEKHRLEKVKSCLDCKNLENKSHTYSVTKNNNKKAVEREKLEKQVFQLTKIYEFLKQKLVNQRNLPTISEYYRQMIDDALLYEPEITDEGSTMADETLATIAQKFVSSGVKKNTFNVRKHRETAKQKESELHKKREILCAKIERFVIVLELMEDTGSQQTLTQL